MKEITLDFERDAITGISQQDILELIKSKTENIRYTMQEVQDLILELNEIEEIRVVEDIPNQIIETVIEYCDNDTSSIKETLSEFAREFNKNSLKYIGDLKETLNEYCDSNCYCRHCFRELEVNTYSEAREHFGSECYEDINEYYCINGCQVD
ncbi:MAG: hypothetical protein RSC24_06495 [Clostridium sp.]